MSNPDSAENREPALSQEEIEQLSDYLLSDAMAFKAMDMAALDGFLTAMAAEPAPVAPEIWLPHIWGGKEALFDSPEPEDWFMERIARHYNAISAGLAENPPQFEPILYSEEVEGETRWMAESWCEGFIETVQMAAADWSPLINSSSCDLLMPIVTLGTPEADEALARLADPERKIDLRVELLGPCVLRINQFWRARRTDTVHRRTPRNAACPCGSGRKFKRCCGA